MIGRGVYDGSVREAVEKVGGELFAIVHRVENADWLRAEASA